LMNYSCPNNLIEIKQGIKNNITKNTQCDIKRKINAGIFEKGKGIQNKSFDRFVNGMVLSLFSIAETIKTKEAMNYVARYKKHP
ncbi:hypothetical protein ACSLNR_27955, partial [Escherichia coli]|uniref:hypothetical protein n=1 Tax=Escherichia coli TaxID=562 RepID=UPI003EE09D3A